MVPAWGNAWFATTIPNVCKGLVGRLCGVFTTLRPQRQPCAATLRLAAKACSACRLCSARLPALCPCACVGKDVRGLQEHVWCLDATQRASAASASTARAAMRSDEQIHCSSTQTTTTKAVGRRAGRQTLARGRMRNRNLVDPASSIRLSQRLSHACLSINNSIL